MVRSPAADDRNWGVFAQALGNNLQRLRLARDMSQEHVAYAAGLSRYTYQKYEKGESRPGTGANPSLRVLLALAQVLDVGLGEIVPHDAPDLKAH